MTVKVKISGIVSTQRYGTLETGDILRTDPEYARFLVEDCQAGSYVTPAAETAQEEQPAAAETAQEEQPAAAETAQEEQPAAAPKRAAKKKEKPQ